MASRKPARPASIATAGKEAHAAWDDLVADLEPFELTASRRAGMEALALQIARMREAAALISTEGMTTAGADGVTRPHPALAIERAAAAEIRDWTNRLT